MRRITVLNFVIYRPVNHIGDTLFVFPVLQALRVKFPQAHITFVSYALVLPLAHAWGLADTVLDCRQKPWKELTSAKGIRNPQLLDLLKGADCVICWETDNGGVISRNLPKAGVKDFFVVPENPPDIASTHIADIMVETVGLQALGIQDVVASYLPPRWNAGNDLCLYTPPIAVHPGATSLKRRWPAPYFATVINQLLRFKYPVLLLAGPAEFETLISVRMHISPRPGAGLLTILKNAPLLQVAAQLQQCRFFLGNDSGISHMAGLLGVPLLGLFGPTDPALKRPAGPHVQTLRENPIENLSPSTVIEHILRRI